MPPRKFSSNLRYLREMLTMCKTLGKMIYRAIIAIWFISATPRGAPGRVLAIKPAFD
jgi:hypothetical protein